MILEGGHDESNRRGQGCQDVSSAGSRKRTSASFRCSDALYSSRKHQCTLYPNKTAAHDQTPHFMSLQKTLDYLFNTLLSQDPSLKATHSFIRDRTRSIRQDFTVQSEKGEVSIESHERMARYHIHALHMLCETEGFSVQQEMEQLRKSEISLIGLMIIYSLQ